MLFAWLLTACGATAGRPAASGQPLSSRACAEAEVAVQVLGSGGPIADDGRASSGYLVWVDGRARLLVDAGPGTVLRFAEAGADPADLDAILISHLHVDHSGDLAGLLKSASFGRRRAPLPIVGPTGSDRFPSLSAYLDAVLGEGGAYPYLGGYLGDGQPFVIEPREVEVNGEATRVDLGDGLTIRAVGVPHGPVPALAFEVAVAGRRIGFMGDQRADEPRYLALVRGVDLLVAHMAIGARAGGVAAHLHAPPAQLGVVARDAAVGRLVLSHLMGRALRELEANVSAVRARFDGPIRVAEDGLCLPLPSTR